MTAQTLFQLQWKFKCQSRSSIKLSHTHTHARKQESRVCEKFCLLHCFFVHFSHFLTPNWKDCRQCLAGYFVHWHLYILHLITMSCIQKQIQDASLSYNTSVKNSMSAMVSPYICPSSYLRPRSDENCLEGSLEGPWPQPEGVSGWRIGWNLCQFLWVQCHWYVHWMSICHGISNS